MKDPVFNNNDRPGILLSNSINKYLDYYGVACGKNIILFTNNDSAYETAISLHKKGIKNLIVDLRKNSQSEIAKQAQNLGIKIYFNHVVTNTFGYRKINSVELMELSDDGNTTIGNKIKLNCDCLGISGGWTPMVHMHTQSGGKLDFKNDDQVFIPKEIDNDQISVGACNGDFDLETIIDKTVNKINIFLEINNHDYKNTKVDCSIEKEKKIFGYCQIKYH